MTPRQFIDKWKDNPLTERAGAQAYFLDLCEVLGVGKPGDDPENYTFERGATRTGAGHGWADVWKRGFFAWENKGPHSDLQKALRQLMTYALALDNPPLLVVCDRGIIEVHTHFTGTPSEVHTILLEDLGTPENLQRLRWVFTDPEQFKPRTTLLDITAFAAGRFADIAQALTARGHDPQAVAHFLIQCLFCMFAEDVGLLPQRLFGKVVEKSAGSPAKLAERLGELFNSMKSGGEFLLEDIQWFNGGLFETIAPLELEAPELKVLLDASRMNWSQIEPSIFGTLFERGLDPSLRSQLGANFTDPETIRKIIDPAIAWPLAAEWETAKRAIETAMASYHAGGRGSKVGLRTAQDTLHTFMQRLAGYRVLDAACGSGNFLYLALRALKDLEHRANLEAEALGLQRQLTINCGPDNVLGIEINPYAAELARVTIWIGEIQWMLNHGYDVRRNPILSPLEHVQCRDAVVDDDGSEPEWPRVDAIIGNPPFLGNKKMIRGLGERYVERLRACYAGRVPGGADLVTYWFAKAHGSLAAGTKDVGLVATQGIRGTANRKVVEQVMERAPIADAWSDEPWVNEGAAVRVSLLCFSTEQRQVHLNGRKVAMITADLTATHREAASSHVTGAARLKENASLAFQGVKFVGDFAIDDTLARRWLQLPDNPNGRPNADVLVRWVNGMDLTRRPGDKWLIDFGLLTEAEAALFEAPFAHLALTQRAARAGNRESRAAGRWWLHQRARPELRQAVRGLPRYIATPEVSKYRLFVFLPTSIIPSGSVYAIARHDDASFGILQSRIHEVWALALCTWLGKGNDPRYTPTTTLETFPFPPGMEPTREPAAYANAHAGDVADAARRLHEFRENWLNPSQWSERIPEVVPGYPPRIVPKEGKADELKNRTLTKLYNERPAWLANAHDMLDAAVARAYGWEDYSIAMSDEEILRRLVALNHERHAADGD